MSELRSTIEALRSEVLAALPDARVEDDFVELREALVQLEIEGLRRLAELERRRIHTRDGHLSIASWLVARLHVGWGRAKRDARLARGLERMPETRAAVEAGDVSLDAAEILSEAERSDPSAFVAAASMLVDAASRHSLRDFRRVVWHWREAALREAHVDPDEILRERRHLHASTTFMGMVRLDGLLDPETGGSLLTAIGSVLDTEARNGHPDERTPAQRRADALGEVCRGWLDGTERPTVAGERPHLNLVVDVDALRSAASTAMGTSTTTVAASASASATASPAQVELDHVGPVPAALARRLACDANVSRVVVESGSEPLDVGRKTAVVPAGLRRAVVLRDRGCRFPGCDRPHSWCDAHHIVHWADGGATSLDNLVLLCRRHHRAIHQPDGFRIERANGDVLFLRPDGSQLEDRAPP